MFQEVMLLQEVMKFQEVMTFQEVMMFQEVMTCHVQLASQSPPRQETYQPSHI